MRPFVIMALSGILHVCRKKVITLENYVGMTDLEQKQNFYKNY